MQLGDGTVAAIKRLEENATLLNFNSELQLASLQHINLIKLLGWCVHGKERILVYELMQQGSLDSIIFGILSQEYSCFPRCAFSMFHNMCVNL